LILGLAINNFVAAGKPMQHNVGRARKWRANWHTATILVLAIVSVVVLVLFN
jgi:hypothetical protein